MSLNVNVFRQIAIFWDINKKNKNLYLRSLRKSVEKIQFSVALSNQIFLPAAYSPAHMCFGRERGWWITCNYPTVLKE
jgi:hypothetical protein